jgi:PAS domain S-box-containing protein
VLDFQTGSLTTYPRWVYGMELHEPIAQSINTPDFDYSVAVSHNPYMSNDVLNDKRALPGYLTLAQRFNITKAIIVPLVVADRGLGELGVSNPIDRNYTPDDVSLLQTVSSQIAAALERLRLYEATGQNLTRRMQELDAISRVSNELTLTLELDKILDVIRHEAAQATGATGSTVALLKPVEVWKAPDKPELDRRVGAGNMLPGLADIEREAIARGADTVLVTDYEHSAMKPSPKQSRSAIASAILYVDQVVGVIHLQHDQPNHFDDRAATFLMTLSSKASLGYGNAIRYKEQLDRSTRLRRRVDQLNQIFELGHLPHNNTDPLSMLEAICYSVQQSVGFDTVAIALVDEPARELRRVAFAGLPVEVFEATKNNGFPVDRLKELLDKGDYRIGESFFFPVEDLRKWYVEGASALSLTFAGNRTMESHGKQMWHDGDLLLVKMTGSDGNLIGVMTLDRPYDNQRPDRTTFEILEIFAHQAATAVENARLYISTTRSAEQEARINEVMEAVASTLDIDHIVESVARGMYSLVPFSRMSVALLDATEQGFDMLRIVPRGQGDFEVTMDHRPSLANTALARSYQEGVDYVYLPGDSEGASYNDLQEWFKNGEQISLVLPLVTGGQRLGAMHLGSDTPKFTGFIESRTVLRRMAQLTAGAVQNTRLFNQAVNLQVLNQSVVMSIQQGIVVLNNSGQIISINDFMRQRYGWDNRAIHADLFEYRPPWAEFLAQDVREVLENGALHDRINQRFVDENGRENVSSFYTYPLRSDNVIRGAVLLVEDVTERWELEKAIENRANQLAALTEVSSRITASLERDEVIALALKEMGWVIPYDTMTVWRRNGSFMVLEGASGVPSLDTGTPLLEQDIRIRFALYERVRQTVETQRVVTVSTEQGFEEGLPGEENAKSWMGVPLVNQGHVIGMIVLTKNQPGVYEGASEQHVAFAFASQVAIALANADLFEQTFDRTNELGILLEAAQATSLTRDLDDVFRTVVELMFSALDVDDCAIMLWDEVDNSLEVQVDMNRSGDTNRVIPKGTRLNLADYPAKLKALRDREVIVIVADDEAQTYPSEQKELRERDDSARLLVPLVVREQSIGLIQLEQQATNRLVTQQKVRLSRALGSQVAVAIENARLATETSHQFEELLLINDLSRAISGTLNLEDMIKIVRDQVPAVTGSDELYVALYDAETEEITFPLAVRAGKDFAIPPRKLNTDEVSFIIRHRQPLSLGADYYSPDEMRRNLGITNGEGDTKSYMGVPLIAGDQVVGVLAVRDSQRTRAFTLNDRRILTTVGSQLGAAIQNARLFSQVSNFADDLNRIVEDRTSELAKERDRIDTLYQITSELARTLDMDRLLNRALGMVAKAVGAEDGAILLIDSITDQLYTRSALNPGALIPGDPDSHPTHPAESIATWLIEHERAVVVDDLHDADYWNPEAQGAVAWRSALGVILETNEDIQGVMVLLARKPAAFSDSHLRLLVAAANQVASAINNADLYQLIRDQAERLGKLLRAEQEEAEKNSAILEGIADGVILADANGGVILFNSAAERILGVAREQIIGQSLSKLSGLYTGSAPWLQAIQEWANRDWSQTGAGEVGDFVDERLDLGEKVVSIHLSPVHINDAFLGTVSVFRDITRDVEVDRMKSEFIANVSHELRTPMTSIKGYADLMLMGAAGLPTDSQKQFLTVIKENADRLTSLVEDVLDISRIDSGREKLKVDAIDLQDLIDDVVSNLIAQPHHQQKEIHLTTQIDSNVPVIQADHDKLAQALTNIVDNAFNYTHPGGSIDIRVQMQADDKHVLISVSDTGIGIPEDFREAIWRRFERYEQHALVMDVPGTGLGLPIVKELVSMHHGDVWFESELNKGTTFYISLPVDQSGFPATTATTEVVRFGSEGAGRD